MKLIIEDPDIVRKINDNLSPQIRVWGIERTNSSFSAYQLCDSRIYEYLIPSHSFLPPHPESYLGKKLVELAEEAGDLDGYRRRQEEVATFWEETEQQYIKPIIETLDPSLRPLVLNELYHSDIAEGEEEKGPDTGTWTPKDNPAHEEPLTTEEGVQTERVADPALLPHAQKPAENDAVPLKSDSNLEAHDPKLEASTKPTTKPPEAEVIQPDPSALEPRQSEPADPKLQPPSPIETALRTLRAAIITAKNATRLPPPPH